ncbi:hypothetical protein EN759_00260 [Mesorhizobium sp. M00.F.Ca.ET.038.03.1.1]|nr:hypothetical protein EN759_00260 [Mesorhizobium sp. M00.F.Ca.ET.038.03.1.1]TIW04555.1 MAG: hypothetical protein E5V77_00130 [Mesorhizobium sp.]
MGNRGYLKDDGSAKRFRFVKSGYDATDEAVPPNKVIFDSKDIGTMSILEIGQYSWTNTKVTGLVQVRAWNYGFIPLCMFHWYSGTDNYWRQMMQVAGTGDLIKVDATGIYVNMVFDLTYPQVTMRWFAFGLPADT